MKVTEEVSLVTLSLEAVDAVTKVTGKVRILPLLRIGQGAGYKVVYQPIPLTPFP